MDHVVPISDLATILSSEEKAYLHSLDTLQVLDESGIKALAASISQGSFAGRLRGRLAYRTPVVVRGFKDDQCLVSFTIFHGLIVAEDKGRFEYAEGLPNLEVAEPSEVRLLRLRFQCADHLSWLYTAGTPARRHVLRDPFEGDAGTYSRPEKWCDAVIRTWRIAHAPEDDGAGGLSPAERWMATHFTCPGASSRASDASPDELGLTEQRQIGLSSHYAMNPGCRADSPPDTVLLFETNTGWNQHGGPDLFAFDHHDPPGGCVLLKDGTVEFIRTGQELRRLRWK